ncbi:hypothetical protein HPP92_000008 [Vanilla planifolia]|uniref:Peptidase S8/S53 domain-containing protein n=1 Tax=Vanilla planifolia TaxID=51239 RepID=A0A835S4S8_VANPL|nr:hypothetical protein HPP92_000008 [Vanilla planifolia]
MPCSSRSPVGTISPVRTEIGPKPAPTMAAFSSRGPNIIAPQILKPDITAPGVDILASNSEATLFAISTDRNATLPFIAMSGTSMSCPHVAGVMGLLRKLYPNWSPAAIRSTIMTTAKRLAAASTRTTPGKPIKDADKEEATPFAYGSGHIQPDLAVEPGLVYDMDVGDYLTFLCSYG